MNATMMNVSTSLLFSLMNSTKYVIDNSSTGVIDPSPVNDLLIHNVTSCSFFATWSSKFLLNYTVKLLTSEQEVLSFDTDKQEWLVTGLKPGALYVLRVVSKVCALEGQVTESTVRTALTSEFATVSHTRQTATSASTAAFSQRSTTSTISPEIQKTSPLSVTCMSQNISVAVTKAFLNQKAISESSLPWNPQCNVSSSNDTHVMLTTAKGICGTNTTYLIKTADLDPSQNYILGFHPHGILVAGAFVNFCTEATGFSVLFPGMTPYLLMLPLWFRTPFFRDYIMCGGLIPSDKESATYLLENKQGGSAVVIAIGGAPESLDARPGAFTLLLKNRKGFVRLAIEKGAHLVPIFSFGENEVFDQVENPRGTWLRWIQERLQKVMGVALPLFHARGVFQYSFGLIPYRKPIFTVARFHAQDHQTFAKSYKHMHEIAQSNPTASVRMLFEKNPSQDLRRYNAPTCHTNVAAIFVREDGEPAERDICICPIGNSYKQIAILCDHHHQISCAIPVPVKTHLNSSSGFEASHPTGTICPDKGLRKRASSETDKQQYKTPPPSYNTATTQPIAITTPSNSPAPKLVSSSLDAAIDLTKTTEAEKYLCDGDSTSESSKDATHKEGSSPHFISAMNGSALPVERLSTDGHSLTLSSELCCSVEQAEEIMGTEATGFSEVEHLEGFQCIPVDHAVAVECDEQVLGELDAAGFEEFSRRIYALSENTSSFRRPRKNSDK
ncbi:MOG2A acyltransferase, partial [Polypterus senegalus]